MGSINAESITAQRLVGFKKRCALRTLFQQAASAGRGALNPTELGALLATLGIGLADDLAAASASGKVELQVSLHHRREFGMVIGAGLGGLDGELSESNFHQDRAAVHAAVELSSSEDFLRRFKRTLTYQKLAGIARREQRAVPDGQLKLFFERLLQLARDAAPESGAAPWILQTLTLELLVSDDQLLVVGAQCALGVPSASRLPRPIEKIDKLLHPASIGIIGVSASNMNFGRIILRNLVASGYSQARLSVIRPGESEIDGIKCVENLHALEHKLDLLIVAADAVYGLVDEIIASDAVQSVMLIPGGLGETKKSREPAAALAAKINAAHGLTGGGPIFHPKRWPSEGAL